MPADERQDLGMQENAHPAKSTAGSRSGRGQSRQQPNTSATDTTATESNEIVHDKDTNAFSSNNSAYPPVDAPNAARGDVALDKPVPNLPADADLSSHPQAPIGSSQTTYPDVLHQPTTKSLPLDTSPAVTSQNPTVNVISATPVVQPPPEETIADRTAIQEDRDAHIESDVPMTNAEAVAESEKEREEQEILPTVPEPDLPPPPSQMPEAVSHPSDHKWLLPPLRSELKGRKCLVLDLDETLVHSSFKVCLRFETFSFCRLLTLGRSFTRQISPFPWRLRVNTTMSM